jgi:hypothetical protein
MKKPTCVKCSGNITKSNKQTSLLIKQQKLFPNMSWAVYVCDGCKDESVRVVHPR